MELTPGSFGHFQASKSEVHKGGLERSFVKAGFVATRISVRSYDTAIDVLIFICYIVIIFSYGLIT